MQLSFDQVTKMYGPVIGVNHVSCKVESGITALFGANGAGKSTLMKLASGQLRPSSGEVRIGPYKAWATAAKRHLGFCPDLNRFYEDMTGREFVTILARLNGYAYREARERTDFALERVSMADRAERKLAGCSHGMRQRIKLAQAIVHTPEILILDEPFESIDPGGRQFLAQLLETLAAEGVSILISTHILSEIEGLADSILMIARGRIIASGGLSEIRNLLDDRPYIVEMIIPQAREFAAMLLGIPEVLSIEIRGEALLVQTTKPTQFFAHVGELVLKHGLVMQRMQILDAGAEAVFDYLQQAVA